MKTDAIAVQAERRIRSLRVMLDYDLAKLYGVETGALNRAVKRNTDRFPDDFMFQLTAQEAENLRCQFGISSLPPPDFLYGGEPFSRRVSHYPIETVVPFDQWPTKRRSTAEN